MDATVVKAAPANLWTIWTGKDSVALLQSHMTWKNHLHWSVSKLTLFDFLTQSCCEVHDQCYTDAMQHPECWPIVDNPYTEFYAYDCNEANKKVTCTSEYSLIFIFIPENINVVISKVHSLVSVITNFSLLYFLQTKTTNVRCSSVSVTGRPPNVLPSQLGTPNTSTCPARTVNKSQMYQVRS